MRFTDVIANPPASLAEWDLINRKEHNLHHKWPRRIRQMYRMHNEKAVRIEKDYQDHVKFPDAFVLPLVDSGLSRAEAQAAVVAETAQLDNKRKHLEAIVKCCRVELEIRDLLIADRRHPVEPDEVDTIDEKELPVETKTITRVDLSIKRDPTG